MLSVPIRLREEAKREVGLEEWITGDPVKKDFLKVGRETEVRELKLTVFDAIVQGIEKCKSTKDETLKTFNSSDSGMF